MHVPATLRLLPAIALVASLACASNSSGTRRGAARLTALVEVSNSSWFDVVVYSVGVGPRWRLGMVRSMDTQTFRIPHHNVAGGDLRLMVDPIGSGDVFVSARIAVAPGQRVELMLAPLLSQSYYALRW